MNSRRQNTKRRPQEYGKVDPPKFDCGEQISAYIEPYVDADNIAEFLGERRENVLKMARERRITAYPISGRVRRTYKFKRSEVAADMDKIRRPSTPQSTDPSDGSKEKEDA